MVTIKISEFSRYPAGRDEKDGPYNGSKYRETILRPALHQAISLEENLIVQLDGVKSFGSSFLEEAFGGLYRVGLYEKKKLSKIFKIEANDPIYSTYKRQIEKLIKDG